MKPVVLLIYRIKGAEKGTIYSIPAFIKIFILVETGDSLIGKRPAIFRLLLVLEKN